MDSNKIRKAIIGERNGNVILDHDILTEDCSKTMFQREEIDNFFGVVKQEKEEGK